MPTTFTWINVTPNGDAWTTTSDWTPTPAAGNFTDGSSDFLIATGNGTITGFSHVDVGNLTIDDANITANISNAGQAYNFTAGFTIDAGTMNAQFDNGSLTDFEVTGSAVIDGTLNIGSTLVSSPGFEFGTGTITGTGVINAISGFASLEASASVLAGSSISFEIGSGATLWTDANYGASSGSVDFTTNSGLLVVDSSQYYSGGNFVNGATFGETVGGLAAGGSFENGIDFTQESTIASAVLSGTNNDILTVTDGSGHHLTVDLSGNYIGDTAAIQADGSNGGFDVFIMVCFAAGTAVLSDHGEMAVETIRPGQKVITLVDGVHVSRAVKWVGRRDIDLTRHPNREAAAPVRIARGALGEDLPQRELVLSGDHCLFIDGRLYPAKLLINDMTITRDMTAASVSYYHVELEQHSVMFVEGVAAESYLDTGNRSFFSNAGLATMLHPEFTINESLRCWETDACAPLTIRPELVKPVWQRFADRALALGHTPPVHTTTDDAAIHLVVDGATVRPLVSTGSTISFMLPATAKSIRLVSRATRQSALMPWLDDPRTLGVAIRSVTLRDKGGESVLGADHPALRDGWHAAERGADGALWRWSTGNAALPLNVETPCMVEIALSDTATYIEDARRLAA